MNKELRFNICDLPTSFFFDSGVPDLQHKVKTNISEALRYACKLWSTHLIKGNFTDEVHGRLLRFLEYHLLFWIEVLNLTQTESYTILEPSYRMADVLPWLKDKIAQANDIERKLRSSQLFLYNFIMSPFLYTKPTGRKLEDWPFSVVPQLSAGTTLLQLVSKSIMSPVRLHSPESTTFAAGLSDGTISFWDTKSGQLVAGPFKAHDGLVRKVAISLNSGLLASKSDGATVCFWDIQTGNLRVTSPVEDFDADSIRSFSFSSDSSKLVSGSKDGKIIVWDAATDGVAPGPFQLSCVDTFSTKVMDVAFTLDGSSILSVCKDAAIRVLDACTGAVLFGPFGQIRRKVGDVASVAFSVGRMKIAVGYSGRHLNGTVRIYNSTGSISTKLFAAHGAQHDSARIMAFPAFSLMFSPDGKLISGHMQTVKVWTLRPPTCSLNPSSSALCLPSYISPSPSRLLPRRK
ncbi:hypothetical protein D9613_011767 [Agrocybe pediades]|uniref:Uncharacterized protein n=1 Tax=Agrocybe pediades TaxID=84607 RepID=A0A8H4QKM4_9AGAR|nr:hypothetical protein D9613_011767 [Agrocybe pediades]